MESNKKNIWHVILQIIIILSIGSGSIWVASLFSKEKIEPTTAGCPLDSKSYDTIRSKKNLIVLENKPSYGVNGSFAGHDHNVLVRRTGLQSKIACGYLFYRVSVGNNPIELNSEGLYMTLTSGKQFGGHILPDQKNSISITEVGGKTEILMPLNSIYYDGTARVNIKQADWVSLLNVADQISFNIALNTVRNLGHIDSVEIAYKCWNPQTGEETDDCDLEVVE